MKSLIFKQFFCYLPTVLLMLSVPTNALGMPVDAPPDIEPLLMAQIIPDNFLGPENSQVISNDASINRIEGGAVRGTHLFHSFEEFNVGTGQSVYFAEPNGVLTILGRVTGDNGSDILGTLGVDGTANLFLLNPNGIMFGPDAELDIQGSFLATTADDFTFAGGKTFGAIDPEAPPLLTVNVTSGVQFGGTPQGNIISTGNLETGQNLTLLSNQLYLEGQVIAGSDLTLRAQDTVTIRDTATAAFVARSGNDLTIQGDQGIDIRALQHLEQTPFVSGRGLLLISDGEVSGDAHFESRGNLQFLTLAGTPGNFVSYHNPIIFADGDVVFGDYEGVALKVEATGSIQAGNIRIIGPDTTLIANGSGADEDLLASSSAAILRAGVQSISQPNIRQIDGGTTTFTRGSVANEPPGSILVTTINTMSNTDGGDGGPIILEADGDITTLENLDSLSRSSSGDANNGGNITISSLSGDITINGRLSSFSQTLGDGSAGNGANISVSSVSGNITTNDRLNSFSFVQSPTSGGSAGNAGNITISSISGNISINDRANAFSSSSSDGGSSDGGNITISSTSGDISINRLDSSSSFFAPEPNINTPASIASTGNGGNITVSAITGDILINGFLASLSTSRNGDVGSGGNISLFTKEGVIVGSDNNRISTTSISGVSGNTGVGGKVTLQATSISDLEVSTVSSDGVSGDVELEGAGNNLTVSNLRLITSGQEETLNPAVNNGQATTLELSEFDQSGRTIITSLGDLTLNNVEILSDSNRSADAGNVEISSTGNIQLNNSQVLSNTNVDSNGDGGSVIITGVESITLNNSLINTDTDGSGRAGDIRFFTPVLNIWNGAQITAATNSLQENATGGGIAIEADKITLSGDTTEISVNTSGPAAAGSITLRPFASGSTEISTLGDSPQFSASTASGSSGRGGDILVQDADIALLRNTELVTSSDGSGNAGNILVEDVNVLLLRQDSLLQAGASANGDGGNIDIDATIVVTVPNENNDILADTNSGTGGNIDITAAAILGFRAVDAFSQDLDSNGLNDISARSERGEDGNVTLTNLNTDPNQGLLELPDSLADQSGLIVQQCLADTGEGQSTFVLTGRGGVPPSPGEVTRSETAALVDLETYTNSLESRHDAVSSLNNFIAHSQFNNQTKVSPQLIEAQGWSVDETGTVQLIAQVPNHVAQLTTNIDHVCPTP